MHPLTDWQAQAVQRINGPDLYNCEIFPRGHCKTTIIERINPVLAAITGRYQYQVIIAISEANYEGNLRAVRSVFESPQFEAVQWLSTYLLGTAPPRFVDNRIEFESGAIIEFRSIHSELRGMNRAEAGGRPDCIVLGDIIPTEARRSTTQRDEITDLYTVMIGPMGRINCRHIISGTVIHKDDLLGLIRSGKLQGFTVTPDAHQRAYNESTRDVLFAERWTYDDLMRLKSEKYDSIGRHHLWRSEMLNDPSEADSNPLAGLDLPIKPQNPDAMYRVLAVDHAHGTGGDKFVLAEVGRGPDGKDAILRVRSSNQWNLMERINQTIEMIKSRRPARVVIEDTSESRSFIELLREELAKAGIFIKIDAPKGAAKGNKNDYILSQWEYRLTAGYLSCAPGPWVADIKREMVAWSIDSKTNADDILDAVSVGLNELVKPNGDRPRAPEPTGNPSWDIIMNRLHKAKTKRRFDRTAAIAGGW